jgi:hypothetical protein
LNMGVNTWVNTCLKPQPPGKRGHPSTRRRNGESVGKVKITLQLPGYLVEWLYRITRDMARTPDDFITEILHRYYDIWILGRESCTSQ